jgi:hypothetical protein
LYKSGTTPAPTTLISHVLILPPNNAKKKDVELKQKLVQILKLQLPSKMGPKYTETVVTCLTCLDKTNNAFGYEAEFLDVNGPPVGVRYIEKVSSSFVISPFEGSLLT